MRSIVKIKDPAVLMSGLFPDLPASQDALWRDGENVRFGPSGARKSEGYNLEPTSDFAGADYKVTALAQSFNNGAKRVYYGCGRGRNELALWDTGAQRSLGGGYASGEWSFEVWGNFLLATNDADPVQVWKGGAGNAEALAGVGAQSITHAYIVKKLRNHVLLYNSNVSGRSIHWCSLSNIEEWAQSSTTSAGSIEVRDLDSDIQAVCGIGDVLAFYSTDSMGLTQYIGAPLYFSNEVKLNGIGAVGKGAVAQVGRENFGLGPKGFWRTDGYTFSYIDNIAVRKWYKSVAENLYAARTVAFHNETDECIEWHFPCQDGSVRGLAFYYNRNGAWSKLKMEVTAAIEQQVLPHPIVGVGKFFAYYGEGFDAGDVALDASLRSAIYDGGSRDQFKWWEMLRMDVTPGSNLQFRFGYAEVPEDDEIEWEEWQTFTRENYPIDGPRESLYFSFELRTVPGQINSQFELGALDVLGRPGAMA